MKAERGGWRPLRREELRDELVHDAYKSGSKLPEPTRCSGCGSVYQAGRWTWNPAPPGAHEVLCPACSRIRDELPAGFVHLGGEFPPKLREELLQLAWHREAREKATHAVERIMSVKDVEDGILITTTDIHLARAIGDALHAAYKGELSYHYNKSENLLRVEWRR